MSSRRSSRTWTRTLLNLKHRGGRRAGHHPKRACSTDQSTTTSFTKLRHPLTRGAVARAAVVKVPRNRAVTRLDSSDSGRNPEPQAILRLVGAPRLHEEIRQNGLYATYTPGRPGVHFGTRSILRGDSRFPHRGEIRVSVSPPIQPDGEDWAAAVRLRDLSRDAIFGQLDEPDLLRD